MHLGKFHSAVSEMVNEFNSKEVLQRVQTVINHLDSLASNPGNPDIANTVRSLMKELKTVLMASSLNSPRPTLAALLDSMGAKGFVGEQMYQHVEDAVQQNGMTPQLAAAKLRELVNKIATYYDHLRAIDSAFSTLEVEYEEIDDGEGELAISIPEPPRARLLSELASTAGAWDKALRPFVELADPDHNPIVVRTISSSDWQFYLNAAPSVLLAISTVVAQVNELLGQIVETKKLVAQLLHSGVAEEATRQISLDAENRLSTRSREIAEQLVAQTPPADIGRGHELEISITRSVKFIAKELSENVKIEVRYLPPQNNQSEDPGEIKRIETLTAAAEKITQNMSFPPIDSVAAKMLNLPAPDPEE